jgi:thioredoxin reductase (NADPH)
MKSIEMIKTDILIIEPVQLVCRFEGFIKIKMSHIRRVTTSRRSTFRIISLKAHLRYPLISRSVSRDLVGNLMEQIKQFEPGFTLGERAETIENKRMGLYCSNKGTLIHASVAIAGGLGSFEPRNHL